MDKPLWRADMGKMLRISGAPTLQTAQIIRADESRLLRITARFYLI